MNGLEIQTRRNGNARKMSNVDFVHHLPTKVVSYQLRQIQLARSNYSRVYAISMVNLGSGPIFAPTYIFSFPCSFRNLSTGADHTSLVPSSTPAHFRRSSTFGL